VRNHPRTYPYTLPHVHILTARVCLVHPGDDSMHAHMRLQLQMLTSMCVCTILTDHMSRGCAGGQPLFQGARKARASVAPPRALPLVAGTTARPHGPFTLPTPKLLVLPRSGSGGII
jgi:hypothetical protein